MGEELQWVINQRDKVKIEPYSQRHQTKSGGNGVSITGRKRTLPACTRAERKSRPSLVLEYLRSQ